MSTHGLSGPQVAAQGKSEAAKVVGEEGLTKLGEFSLLWWLTYSAGLIDPKGEFGKMANLKIRTAPI
jgi:hypothetical protein